MQIKLESRMNLVIEQKIIDICDDESDNNKEIFYHCFWRLVKLETWILDIKENRDRIIHVLFCHGYDDVTFIEDLSSD